MRSPPQSPSSAFTPSPTGLMDFMSQQSFFFHDDDDNSQEKSWLGLQKRKWLKQTLPKSPAQEEEGKSLTASQVCCQTQNGKKLGPIGCLVSNLNAPLNNDLVISVRPGDYTNMKNV